MNREADEKLRQAVREWLEASPAAGASLHVCGAVFVRVGTVAQLREVTPREELGADVLALRQVFARDLRDMWGRLTIETTELEETLRVAAGPAPLKCAIDGCTAPASGAVIDLCPQHRDAFNAWRRAIK